MKKMFSILCLFLFLISSMAFIVSPLKINSDKESRYEILEDYDPLIDINITFEVLAIRALDKIDCSSDPDFFVKVIIDDEEFVSPIWEDTSYLYNCWNVTKDVSDDVETVNITIQLWDSDSDRNDICDISKKKNVNDDGYFVNLIYDIRTGLWYGDDYNVGDSSGYGRVNGCGDGSIYNNEYDCELLFDIKQNDIDNDGLPYWVETFVYQTNPLVDNTGDDDDFDGIPIEWEHRYGFNPLIWDDHNNMDPDDDSIDNFEEYLTKDFGSDPYRQDIFLELDYMDDELNGELRIVTQEAIELVQNPFHRRNILFHVDTEIYGGEIIDFKSESTFEEVRQIWTEYFLDNDENNWRRGVYHYAVFVHEIKPGGFAFSGDVFPYWGYIPGTNGFVISNILIDKKTDSVVISKSKDYIYASLIMHEMGHNFGIRFGEPFGCDNQGTKSPLRLSYWLFGRYKSIMNYRYTYFILDYSDGSHGARDYDDWGNIDLSYFEKPK